MGLYEILEKDPSQLSVKEKQALLALQLSWESGDLAFHLNKMQRLAKKRLLATPGKQAIILAHRQFGKSYLGTAISYEQAKKYKGKEIVMAAPQLKQIRRIVRQKFKDLINKYPDPSGQFSMENENKAEGFWTIGSGHTSTNINLFGFDSESSRGSGGEMIIFEESRDFHPDLFRVALNRFLPMLMRRPHGKILHLTTIPSDPHHPFVQETMPRVEEQGGLIKISLDDNHEIPVEEKVALIEEMGGRMSPGAQRELFLEIAKDETTLVIPTYDDNSHTTTSEFNLQNARLLTVGDWGGVRDLTFFVLCLYIEGQDKLVILDERVFGPNTPIKVVVKEVKLMERYNGVIDPPRLVDCNGQTLVELNDEHSFRCELPYKLNRESGMQETVNGFYSNKIAIHTKAVMTRKTLVSAQYNKNRTDFVRTEELGHADGAMTVVYAFRNREKAQLVGKSVELSKQTFFSLLETSKSITYGVFADQEARQGSVVGLDQDLQLVHCAQFHIDWAKEISLPIRGYGELQTSVFCLENQVPIFQFNGGIRKISLKQQDIEHTVKSLLKSSSEGELKINYPDLEKQIKLFLADGSKDSRTGMLRHSVYALALAFYAVKADKLFLSIIDSYNEEAEEEEDEGVMHLV